MMTLKLLRPAVAVGRHRARSTCVQQSSFHNSHRGFATKREQRAVDDGTLTEKSALEKDEQRLKEAAAAAAAAEEPQFPRHSVSAAQWSPSLSQQSSPLIRTDLHRQLTETYNAIKNSNTNSNNNNNTETGGLDLEQAFHVDLFDAKIHLPRAPTDWSGYEAATPLTDHLTRQIGVSGVPVSTAAYMVAALNHPEFGYYVQAGQNKYDTSGAAGGAVDRDDFDDDDDYDNETVVSNKNGAEAGAGGVSQNIIGPTGDFVTAPEVSSIFTETLGIWLYTQHQELLKSTKSSSSSPSTAWQWLECGPGAGTLTVDLIRFAQQLPEFGTSLTHVHLVETSPVLRQVQKERLKSIETATATETTSSSDKSIKFRFLNDDASGDKKSDTDGNSNIISNGDTTAINVCWHDSVAAFQAWQVDHDVSLPIFTVWQEFLDALPVYAFEKTGEGWRERMVDVVIRQELMEEEDIRKEEEALKKSHLANAKKPRFRLVLAPEVTPALKTLLQVDEKGNLPNKELDSAPVGSVIEVNPEAILVAQDLAKLLEKQGGAGLIIDYGQDGSTDSIRAFRKHQQVHFLSRPGQVDVTADVDFAAIRHAVNTLKLPQVQAFGPTTQGQFLMAMGIQERVIQLIESDHTTEEEAENLFEALKRLVGPEEMGARYKVLAIARKKEGIFEPPGFDYLNREK